MLINLQPYARPMQVEVHLGGEILPIGHARGTSSKQAAMRDALAAVESAVAAGRFRRVAEDGRVVTHEDHLARVFERFETVLGVNSIEDSTEE